MNTTYMFQTLCAAAGAALAGPAGGITGNLVGRLLTSILPEASEVIANIVGDLTSDAIGTSTKAVSGEISRRLSPTEKQLINNDLQTAFRDAFREALYDVGGSSCFPEAWGREGRDVPPNVVYPLRPSVARLWRDQNPLAEQICGCMQGLDKAWRELRLLPLESSLDQPAASVYRYFDTDQPQTLADGFFDQVVAPHLIASKTLWTELPDFQSHLRRYLLDRTLVHLGENLKKRPEAWRAFNRLVLEGLREQVQQLGQGQTVVLARLDELLKQPDGPGMNAWADSMAELISATGRIERRLDEGFDSVLQRVTAQHRDEIMRLDAILAGSARLQMDMERVLRVLRVLEDGSYVIKGKPPVSEDTPPDPGDPPFKGLMYFAESDADLFFGREQLVAKLVGHLRHSNLLFVVGASGSGKSSLLRAGLMAALKRNEPLADGTLPPTGSIRWPVHVITPTDSPLKSLAASLTRDEESVTAAATLTADFAGDPCALGLFARRLLSRDGEPTGRLLLIVDQFEELFSPGQSPHESQAFLDNLMQAGSTTVLVIALRADFYDNCTHFEGLRGVMEENQVIVGRMNKDELRSAIEDPARHGGWLFETGLVDLILHDTGDEPGALPLLSHALLQTWQHRRGRMMTLESYAESGGVRKAIAQTADAAYLGLRTEEQSIARNIFLRLTEPGEGTPDTRRRATVSELAIGPEEISVVQTVLKVLTDARLVTTDKDPVTGGEIVQVAHEAIIREWPLLKGWLDDDRAGLRIHRRLTEAVQDWEKLGRDAGVLYRGARLHEAKEWAQTHAGQMNASEREFLTASYDAIEQEEREAERQRREKDEARQREVQQARRLTQTQRRALAGLGVLLIAALAAAAFALIQRDRASQEARIARVRELAAQSQAILESAPQHSLLLGVEAISAGAQATPALTDAKNKLYQALTKSGGLGLGGHRSWSWRMAFSSDSQRLVTGGVDGTVRVWDMTQPDPTQTAMVLHVPNSVAAVAFSPDGRWLAASTGDLGFDPFLAGVAGMLDMFFQMRDRFLGGKFDANNVNTAYLWDLNAPEGQSPIVLSGHKERISQLAFSPDNRWLATGSLDSTIRLYNMAALTTTQPIILQGHKANVVALTISADSRWLVSGSMDTTARLWDLTAPDIASSSVVLPGHTSDVAHLAITPDGHWLVTASWDKTARLWDLTAPDPVSTSTVIAQHKKPITALAVSPDGRWVATGGYVDDNTVHLWDLAARQPMTDSIVLRGHERTVSGLAFSPDSRWLVSASMDSTLRAWNVSSSDPAASVRVIRGQDSANYAVSISPDGRWLVAGSEDGNVRRWAMSTIIGTSVLGNPATIPLALIGHKDRIVDLAVSPDGRWLATGSQEATARLWDLHSLSPESFFSADALPSIALEGHQDEVYKLAFSADGHWLATASLDDTARLWDLRAANPAATSLLLEGHKADINAVAFSPDGHWLVTASDDYTARLWDIASADPSQNYITLKGHKNKVLVAEFSNDQRWLVTGSMDTTARLWDMTSASPEADPIVLAGHTGQVVAVAFSPDNRWLVTGSLDHTARLWNVTDKKAVSETAVLRGHENYVVTVAFSPDSRWLVTGGAGSFDPLRLWDLTANDLAATPIILQGHKGWVWNAGFTPDGRWLVTSSLDRTVRLWDMNTAKTTPASIVLPSSVAILDHALSPDGRWLFTADERGVAFVWPLQIEDMVNLACLSAGRNMSLSEWDQNFSGSQYRLTCPDLPLHPAFIQSARLIAKGGDMPRAVSYFKLAMDLDPTLGLNPEAEARHYAAEGLVEEGATIAQTEGDVQRASEKFKEGLELNPDLDFDPEKQARLLSAARVAAQGIELMRQGDVLEGLALFEHSMKLDPDMDLEFFLSQVCFWGGRWGYATEVLDACNRTVAVNPESAWARDWRGIVRTQLGDYAEAIEDFRFYVDWSKEHNENEKDVPEREAWIAALEEGQNPFDTATLEALRGK